MGEGETLERLRIFLASDFIQREIFARGSMPCGRGDDWNLICFFRFLGSIA
jgi:hypothetical protein